MAKKKHSHERHPGGRGRRNPHAPHGEEALHYGTSDRSQRDRRAALRAAGLGFVVSGYGWGLPGMTAVNGAPMGGQFGDGDGDADDAGGAVAYADPGAGAGAGDAGGGAP